MAMSPELKKRVITGVCGGIGLLLLIIYARKFGIFIFSTVISLGMVFEFTGITFSMPDKLEKRYLLLTLTWFLSLCNLLIPYYDFSLLVSSFLILFIYFLLTAQRHSNTKLLLHFKELMFALFGLVYVVFFPFYFLRIFEHSHGLRWLILFLLIVWAGDTGAYFAGKAWGKNKLYSMISPKKTWEGSTGGLAAGLLITLLYKMIVFKDMSWGLALFLPICVGTMAQIGDLCESFLKRAFDVKDSGSILPGHGGFLDRFDGVVFSLPVMYACIQVFS